MTRYVFDTNVLISALLFHQSVPGHAFAHALSRGRPLVSKTLIAELTAVLSREKFARYLTSEERDEFLEALMRDSELIEITESIEQCRDPDDDRILELAVSGGASIIVTGDRDLLDLHPFRGISIVTPADLVSVIDQEDDTDKP